MNEWHSAFLASNPLLTTYVLKGLEGLLNTILTWVLDHITLPRASKLCCTS